MPGGKPVVPISAGIVNPVAVPERSNLMSSIAEPLHTDCTKLPVLSRFPSSSKSDVGL